MAQPFGCITTSSAQPACRFRAAGAINHDGIDKWISDPDVERAKRVTEVMLQMKKLDIEPLKRAHEG